MVVLVEPSGEVWIWNAVAYAASHCRTTWVIEALEPRSTCSHCGSENALDQRVPVFPSVAAEAGYDVLCTEDAVVGWPCDSNVAAALARLAGPATKAAAAASALTAVRTQIRRWRNGLNACVTT